ncbi:MAG: Hint domain-containing protein, partial [Candidatus Melainabacteria bacterium]
SFNESTKQLEWKKVLDTFKRKNNKLIVLKLSNGIQIKSTPEHRFFVSTSPASIAGGVRTSNNWIEAAYLEVGMKLLDTELKGITIEEINEELGQVEVYNFEVQDNHNYFAGHVSQDASASFSGVLVHNDYKPNEAQAFNDKAKELQTATLIQPVIDKVINEQPIQGSNTVYSYPFDNTLNDLIQLTNNNSSLNAFQKIEFANQFQVILTKYNQNIINYNEANSQANKVVIQIQLLQGQKALDSGFIAEEANKNLKAAENTIKQIKEQINDPLLEKSLDNITNKVFWTQIELGAWGGIREVAKVFVDKNNIDNALRNQINEIIKLNALSSPEALELFGSQDIRNILSKNTINQSELKELQTFEIDKRKDLSSASTTNEALTKQIRFIWEMSEFRGKDLIFRDEIKWKF